MGGSSKSQTIGYRYFVGVHMVLCAGPIDQMIRILVDGDVAWSGQAGQARFYLDQFNLFGGDSREGGLQGYIDVCLGGPTQPQNNYLLSQLSKYLPAYRGVFALVLNQMYMGLNPYLKQWSIRAQRIHVRQNGLVQWYDQKAQITSNFADVFAEDTGAIDTIPMMPQGSGNFLPALNGNTSSNTDPRTFIIDGEVGFIDSSGEVTFFTAQDNIVITHQQGLTYQAWNFNGGEDGCWENNFQVTTREGVTTSYWGIGNNETVYETAALAEAAVLGLEVVLTGSTQYSIWLQDAAVDDNAGGLSVSIFKGGFNDMNPAHIIRECLTDPDWGMGYAEADMDDASFTAVADQLYLEKLGCSKLWDSESSIEDFISEICQLINASIYVSRSTGLFVLKLIRNDYNVADLITLDPSNIDNISDYVAPTFGSLVNQVIVTYWDAAANQNGTVTAQDIALMAQEGAVISQSNTYDGCTNAVLASQLAQRDLQTLSTPLIACSIETNQIAKGLNIGDVFKFTWPDYKINAVVMRVASIGYGDSKNNAILIKCVQDVFGVLPVNAVAPPASGWVSPNQPAAPVLERLAFEAPYLEIVQTVGQTVIDPILAATPEVGFVSVAAVRPASGGISATFYDDIGAGFVKVGNVDFCPNATLTSPINEIVETIPVSNSSLFTDVNAGTWFQLDTEIMVFQSVSVDGTTITVLRGCLDTIPTKHAANGVLFFWDNYSMYDDTQLVVSDVVEVALCTVASSSVLPISEAPIDSVTIVGRAAMPYPPGNVTVNTEPFPAFMAPDGSPIALAWAHRDRTEQTTGVIVGYTAGNIGPETGVTYSLKIEGETGTVLHSETGVTTTASAPYITELVDSALTIEDSAPTIARYNNKITVNIISIRAGLDCYQPYNFVVTRVGYGYSYGVYYGGLF